MTPEELKEIEERYNVSRGFFQIAVKDIMGMGITSHKDVPRLLAYIKELEHEIEMLSASPDETSARCGTFREELRKDIYNNLHTNQNKKNRTKKKEEE